MPAPTGNGTAMRAALVLRGLAQRYRVSLLVVPLYSAPGTALDSELAASCEQVAELPIAAASQVVSPLALMVHAGTLTPSVHSLLAGSEVSARTRFGDEDFDIVHMFRLNSVPFGQPYLAAPSERPKLHLDLDDIESLTAARLADLHRAKGDKPGAMFHQVFARRVQALEAECLQRFDRVYVCSEEDRLRLHTGARAQLCVIPNAVQVPRTSTPRQFHSPFTFLFVGTLGYYPNIDALEFFCQTVVPRIRQRVSLPFRINIVGGGDAQAVSRLARVPEARLIGVVPDVSPWYDASDAVLVPIRAGGGTRIKILEAFAHRVPVVSTELGIEGIAARDEVHALLGNTAEQFAEQCVRLMLDSELAARLSAHAFALVETTYSHTAVLKRIAMLTEPECPNPAQ